MKKIVQFIVVALCFTTQISFAQTTIIYEDGTQNNGKVEWTRTMEVQDAEIGKPKVILLPVKNISKEPLEIKSVKTHCGCTDATAPKGKIAPGETANIEVTFTAKPRYTQDKNGADMSVPPPFTFYQIIDVYTNFDTKNSVVLSVQGTVIK
jgi:hypothetical protein